MADAAASAPVAAQSAPTGATGQQATQTGATSIAGGTSSAPQGGETAAQQRQRIALTDTPDDTEIVLRVDGADVTLTAAEARRRLQTDAASTKRFEEAARMRRDVEAQKRALNEALTDPARFREELSAAGYSPAEIARAILQAEIEEQNMTPEQRRLRDLEREQRRWQAERRAQEEAEVQRVTQAHRAAYERAFASASDLAGVPQSPRVRQVVQSALVDAVAKAVQIGASLDMSQLTSIARQAYQEHAADYRAALTVEERRALLTEDDIKWWTEQQRAKRPSAVDGTPAPAAQPRDDRGRYSTPNGGRDRHAPAADVNGREVVRSVRDVIGGAWTSRR